MKLSTTKVALLFITVMCLIVTKVIASEEKRHYCDDDDCDWDEWDDYGDYDDDDWEHRGRNRGYEPGIPGMPRVPGVHQPLTNGDPRPYEVPGARETGILYPSTGMPAMVTATYTQVGSSTYYPETGQVVRNSGSRESSSVSVVALAMAAVMLMALNF